MKRIGFIFFYVFTMIVGFFPFLLVYIFSDLAVFFIRDVISYRKKVILSNLINSFPELSKKEIRQMAGKFYRNLTDVMLEGIKAFNMSEKQVLKRHRILNPEIMNPYLSSGRGVICVTGHYCNWEWGALSPPLLLPWKFIAFYKPMKNPVFDKFVRKNRSRFGTFLAPIRETAASFEMNKGEPVIYLMAADQSPSNRQRAYWVDFLGRDTAFLHGPERYARLHDCPVVFVAIRRVKRGFYELELSVLTDNPATLPDGEITRLYAEKLESLIMEEPSNWLWSHKRWKLTR